MKILVIEVDACVLGCKVAVIMSREVGHGGKAMQRGEQTGFGASFLALNDQLDVVVDHVSLVQQIRILDVA